MQSKRTLYYTLFPSLSAPLHVGALALATWLGWAVVAVWALSCGLLTYGRCANQEYFVMVTQG